MKPTIFLLTGLFAIGYATPPPPESLELIHRNRPSTKTKNILDDAPLLITEDARMANIFPNTPIMARDMAKKRKSSKTEDSSSEPTDSASREEILRDRLGKGPYEKKKECALSHTKVFIQPYDHLNCSSKSGSRERTRLKEKDCVTLDFPFNSYEIELGKVHDGDQIEGQGCEVFVYSEVNCDGGKIGYHHLNELGCQNSMMRMFDSEYSRPLQARSAKYVCPGWGYRDEVIKGPEVVPIMPLGVPDLIPEGLETALDTSTSSIAVAPDSGKKLTTTIVGPPQKTSMSTVLQGAPTSHRSTKTVMINGPPSSHHKSNKTVMMSGPQSSHHKSTKTVMISGPQSSRKSTKTAIVTQDPANPKTLYSTDLVETRYGSATPTVKVSSQSPARKTIIETLVRLTIKSSNRPPVVSTVTGTKPTTVATHKVTVIDNVVSSSLEKQGKPTVSCTTFMSGGQTYTKTQTIL